MIKAWVLALTSCETLTLCQLPNCNFLLHKMGIIVSTSWGYWKHCKASGPLTHTIAIYSAYSLNAGLKNTTRDPSGSCNIISPKEKYSLPSFLQMLGHKYRWLIKQWNNTELLFGKHIHTPSFIWAILPIIRFHAFAAPSPPPSQERLLVATAGCVCYRHLVDRD